MLLRVNAGCGWLDDGREATACLAFGNKAQHTIGQQPEQLHNHVVFQM
jgi:hypothetical protein